jgi:hypothetical protein
LATGFWKTRAFELNRTALALLSKSRAVVDGSAIVGRFSERRFGAVGGSGAV